MYFDCLRAQIPGMLGQRLALKQYHDALRDDLRRLKLGLPLRKTPKELAAELQRKAAARLAAARRPATRKATGQKSAKKPARRAALGDPMSAARGMHRLQYEAMVRANPRWWADPVKHN